MLYFKVFENLQLRNVEELRELGVSEGRHLDFKEAPPSQDARSFLETVVSFANSQGGVIVFGVSEERVGTEKTGKIGEICGFECHGIDTLKSKLENHIRDQVQPRVDYRMKEFQLTNGKYVLLVRISQGWRGPYFYRAQRGLFFYRRAESQNVLMEHPQIKEAFLASDSLSEKMTNFRESRVQNIVTQQIPMTLQGERILIMHVLPLDSFRESATFTYDQLAPGVDVVGPPSGRGYDSRPNVDGIFQFWSGADGDHSKPYSYVQFFRNGAIEYVDSFVLGSIGEKEVHIKPFAERLVHSIRRAINYQKQLGLGGPFYVGVSLWNVKNVSLSQTNDRWPSDYEYKFDRDHVHLPTLELPEIGGNEFALCRPLLDMICNAAGFKKCMRFNSSGEWV